MDREGVFINEVGLASPCYYAVRHAENDSNLYFIISLFCLVSCFVGKLNSIAAFCTNVFSY